MVEVKDPYADSETRCPTGSCVDCLALEPIRIKLLKAIEEAQRLATTFCDQLKKVNEAHSNVLRTLPSEITSQIFGYCIIPSKTQYRYAPEEYDYSMPELKHVDYLPPPMKLGSICRTWRQISWSTSSLWKDLVLDLTPGRPEYTKLVHEWIERGKAAGLRISLSLPSRKWSEKMDPSYLEQVRTIASSCAHWEELRLELPYDLVMYITPFLHDLSNLRSLCIHGGGVRPTERIFMDTANASPERVTLVGVKSYRVNINWKIVTHVRIYGVPMDACLEVLRVATNLESAWFCGFRSTLAGVSDFIPKIRFPLTMVVNSKLQYLKYTEDERSTDNFLRWLSLPSLLNLHYRVTGPYVHTNESFFENFANFISRSPSASILELHFPKPNIELEDVVKVLRLARTFSRLHFNGKIPSRLLEALSRAGTPLNSDGPMDEIMLPHIQEIVVRLSADEFRSSYFEWRDLTALFASPSSWFRSRNVSFKIDVHGHWDTYYFRPGPIVLKRLIGLQKEGVEIECTIAPGEHCPYETRDLFVICEKYPRD